VTFGLQFEAGDAAADAPIAGMPVAPAPAAIAASATDTDGADDDEPPSRPSEGAEVVRLDRFRKK